MDGDATQAEQWQLDRQLIISANLLDNFGNNSNAMVDSITINGTAGQLNVAQASTTSWTLASQGLITVNGTASHSISLAGDKIVVEGNIEVVDNTQFSAKLDIASGGQVAINTLGSSLQLGGGTPDDPHLLSGGTIAGPGTLSSDGIVSLKGHGLIETPIEFPANSASSLRASGGTLEITGSVINVNVLGTADDTGTLALTSGLDTSSTSIFELQGGQVTGSFIANNGITRGHGNISVDVFFNNSVLFASGNAAMPLTVAATAGVDLDGAQTTPGSVQVTSGDLTIASPLTDDFKGDATVGGGRTLRFDHGWTLAVTGSLALNGTTTETALLSATSSVLGGTVAVQGKARIAGGTTFQTNAQVAFSQASDRLAIDGTAVVQPTATFTGGGTIENLASSSTTLEHGADVAAVLENHGNLILNGTATLHTLDQQPTGTLQFDIASTSSFDQLLVQSSASLAGMLEVTVDPSYSPVVGDSFALVAGPGSVTGIFATDPLYLPSLGGGLGWNLSYSSTEVVLSIVAMPLYGDFNGDNIVDLADYTVWRNNLGAESEAVIADNGDGLNGVDKADFILWRNHFGESLPGNILSQPVPEPCSMCLLLLAIAPRLLAGSAWR